MDHDRFDHLTRRLSSRRSTLIAGVSALLAPFLGPAAGTEAAPCPKGKKRCGNRCIPKRACCPRTQRRCGNRCVPKQACCPGTKRCGAQCIPATQCCTDAECGAFKMCAGGRCIVREGTCTAADNYCVRQGNFNCDVGTADCACFITSVGTSRCGTRQFLTPQTTCLNDVECAQAFPSLPGVFCAEGGSGENCFSGRRCMAPCLG